MSPTTPPPFLSSSASPAARGRWWVWPLLVVVLLTFQIALSAYGIYRAHASQAAVVEADYYNRALHWDDYQAKLRASEALGWRAAFAWSAAGPAQRTLALTLSDRDGGALPGAQIEGKYFHHADPTHAFDIRFEEDLAHPGRYTAAAPLGRLGKWEFRLHAQRGPEEFLMNHQEMVN